MAWKTGKEKPEPKHVPESKAEPMPSSPRHNRMSGHKDGDGHYGPKSDCIQDAGNCGKVPGVVDHHEGQ